MNKKFLKSIKIIFSLPVAFFLIGFSFAGYHSASQVSTGIFSGDYDFTGVVNFTNATVLGLDGLGGTSISNGEVLPVGTIMAFSQTTCPNNWLEADGSAISRSIYSDLFSMISDTYGVGDGTTTYNIPDYRGYFLRGWDNGAGNDPDSGTRTDSGDGTTGDNIGTIQTDEFKSHAHDMSLPPDQFAERIADTHVYGPAGGPYRQVTEITHNTGGAETRPKNINVLYCIKANSTLTESQSYWNYNNNNINYMDGSVGIGTIIPNKTLDVVGEIKVQNSIYPKYHLQATSNAIDSKNWQIYVTPTGELRFGALNDAEDAETVATTFNRNGSVGIGTTNPEEKLDVRGTLKTQTADSLYAFIMKNTDNGGEWKFRLQGDGTTANNFHIDYVGSPLFMIRSNGRVGIGTTTPDDALDVIGDIDATGCIQTDNSGSIGGTCLSDSRLKENVISISGALDKISELRPVTYNWREDMFNISGETGKGVGLIAQELEIVFPDLVKTEDSGYKKVRYDTELQMYMLASIKELNEKITLLEESNSLIKEENFLLRKRIDKLEAHFSQD